MNTGSINFSSTRASNSCDLQLAERPFRIGRLVHTDQRAPQCVDVANRRRVEIRVAHDRLGHRQPFERRAEVDVASLEVDDGRAEHVLRHFA